MAETHILAQTDAAERARLLHVESYDVNLDLTTGDETFESTSTVRFTCAEPGATTFIEIAADSVVSATLNGAEIDVTNYAPKTGLAVPAMAENNELTVNAVCRYSTSGQGLHRMTDRVDGETYLYSQFEVADAQQMFACFDQPDLKAQFTFNVTVPQHWRAISNMPITEETSQSNDAKTVRFAPTPRMSTYIAALCAGPYHEVTTSHDGIELGLYCRQSMKQYLDPDGVFEITKQGFDHFHSAFGVRYPLPKYDQIFAPEYNMGAMENFGCVTIAESAFLFRSQATEYHLEQRANVILHEMAHMWFGDLVTMRWWEDLWLNESFAEWASHWANVEATKYTGAWTTFLSLRKNWGYRQDQLPTTHPVYTKMPDVAAVATNFDGITYAKGASILKQLVAYVGIEPFKQGIKEYFETHKWGNATFSDLLSSLEKASGRELREFADTWLATAGVSTLRPEITAADGAYSRVAVRQEVHPDYPTMRTHRIGIGVYDLTDGKLVRRHRVETDISGELTEIPELTGVKTGDVLLLNDDDLTYCKLRLDADSLATVISNIASFEDSLPRALCWAAAWDMLRDGELPARDFIALAMAGMPHEADISLITTLQQQLGTALLYADESRVDSLYADVAAMAKTATFSATPGGDMQRSWAQAYARFARSKPDLATLRGWLNDEEVPNGLAIDTDLRWQLLISLTAHGEASTSDIDAELERDNTADGERLSLMARSAVPTAESKQDAWYRITEDDTIANYARRSYMLGFAPASQVDLVRPYVAKYLQAVTNAPKRLGLEQAIEFISQAFPRVVVEQETLDLMDAWLADESHDPLVRRGVLENRDDVARALRARECDKNAK